MVGLLIATMVGGQAFACSCSALTVQEAHAGYPVVFDGTVESIEDQFGLLRKGWTLLNRIFGRDPGEDNYESYYGFRVTFKTGKVWKGRSAARVAVFTARGGGDCGIPFEVGRRYLVYASGRPLATDICSRTAPIERAGEDLRFLAANTQQKR